MNEVMQYIQENWEAIIAACAGVMMAARLIVKITPTPKDDAWVAKIVTLLKNLGLVIPDEPKK